MFDHAVHEGFLSEPHRQLIATDNDVQRLIDRLSAAVVPGEDSLHEA
jgi:hypothetical protein